MKKKKGFTLAEILGVIVILGLLLVLIIPLLVKNINKKKEIAEDTGNKLIYEATEQYVGEHSTKYLNGGTYCIKVKDLIEEGKLVSPVKNIVTGEPLEDKIIKVTITLAGDITYEETSECTEITDEIPFTPGQITARFNKGQHTKEVGTPEQKCTLEEDTTSCEITFPEIISDEDYLFGGWSTENKEEKSNLKPGDKQTITANTNYYGNSIYGKPQFSLEKEGTVKITYPSGCTAPYSCTYKVGGGAEITVTSDSTTIEVGSDATITAKTTDGENTAANTYDVIRTKLYVASSGSDQTGYGTVASPYATINKAYTSATNKQEATIYVMNNITNNGTTTMNANKKIKQTSSNQEGAEGTTINIVTRGNNGNAIIKQDNGSLTIKNITINGNNVSSSAAMITVKNATIESGTTITNANKNDGNGGALYVRSEGNLTINNGSFTNNQTKDQGGAICNHGGTLIIKNGTFSNNKADHGGAVYNSEGTTTIKNGTFTSNSSQYGGAISNARNSTLTIEGGTYIKNSAGGTSGTVGSGGALYNVGTATISGGTFGGSKANKNTARQHGGAIKNWGTCNITDGTISYNESNEEGGGISTDANSTSVGKLTINGKNVLIEYNEAKTSHGGGIFAGSGSTVTLKNGKIQYNTSKKTGGGISFFGNNLSMSGGYILNNTADKSGGGVYIKEDSTMTLSGGDIRSNTTNESSSDDDTFKGGGGIADNGTLRMTGGLIAGNKAPNGDGGGIRIGGAGKLVLSGGIIRKNSAKNSGGIDNAYGDKDHYSGPGKAYVCKNNNPVNSYDKTATSNSHC